MLVVNEYPPQKIAGTAMATDALARALIERGHEVHVVVTTACPVSYQTENIKGLSLSWLPDRPFKGSGVVWRLWHLWRVALLWKPELIQGQAVSCSLIVALVGHLIRIPSVGYAQGQDVYESGWWRRHTEIRWGCRGVSKCLTVTKHLAERVASVSGREDIQVIPHGFSPVEIKEKKEVIRQHLGVNPDTKVVLHVGRLESFKGQDVLLEAWPTVMKDYTESQLWIIGEGSLRHGFEAQAKSDVKFFGLVDATTVAELMVAAHVFVLPSRSEAFGIVLLEAMAKGLPIVASNVGGIPEVVAGASDARLVGVDDAIALARAINMTLDDVEYSDANRIHAEQFAWPTHVIRFEQVYQELLGHV